jgi:hypothetical protein
VRVLEQVESACCICEASNCAGSAGSVPATRNGTCSSQRLDERVPRHRLLLGRGQLREARVAVDEALEVARALLHRAEDFGQALRAAAPQQLTPGLGEGAIGASELLSSWLITRITFFHVCTSWRRSSEVRWRSRKSSWRRAFSVNSRRDRW